MEIFEYKGYKGSIETSIEDKCLYGKILFINDLVNYEAETLPELEKEFRIAVDDYLDTCKELQIEPEKSLSGTFNVRVGPDLHREAIVYGLMHEIKLNQVVVKAVKKLVREKEPVQNVIHNNTFQIKMERNLDDLKPQLFGNEIKKGFNVTH